MANRRRGEVEAIVDGRPAVLCLTLGALCALERAFEVDDLAALADRFAAGRLSARDVVRIFACGLAGGGRTTSEDEVMAMRIDGGLVGATRVVADLLALTFGGETTAPAADPDPRGGEGATHPPVAAPSAPDFPGTR